MVLNCIENRGEDFKHVEFKMPMGHLNHHALLFKQKYCVCNQDR